MVNIIDERADCKDYLNHMSHRLASIKATEHGSVTEAQDIHCFMRVLCGYYAGAFLHLQAYPGMSTSGEDGEIVVSTYIKTKPEDNTLNVASFGQHFLPWDNFDELERIIMAGLRIKT